jgi:AAA ATPase domain/Protein of unknown function (DUF3696)
MIQAPVPWISKLRIENFKSIESADLDLGPLTVLVGANSAGKSSVLQTLVLLSQIVRGRSQGSFVNLNGAELQLGTFADIKHSTSRNRSISFSIVLNIRNDLLSSWRYMPRRSRRETEAPQTLRWSLMLRRPDATQIGSAKVAKVELEAEEPEGLIRAVFEPTRSRNRLEVAAGRRDRITQYRRRGEFGFTLYGLSQNLDASRFYDVRLSGHFRRRPFGLDVAPSNPSAGRKHFSILNNALPVGIYEIRSDSRALAAAWLNGIQSPLRKASKGPRAVLSQQTSSPQGSRRAAFEDYDDIIATLFASFHEWVNAFDADESPEPLLQPADLARFTQLLGDPPDVTVEREVLRALVELLDQERSPQEMLTATPTQFDDPVMYLQDRMSTALWYLGPLREDPSPAYRPGQGGGIARLGLKGEYTVPELERFGSTEIETMLPPDPGEPFFLPVFNEQHEERDRLLVRTSLNDAVDKWMTYLGLASAVQVHETGKAGIELGIVDDQTGDERDLTNVGVGVSQLLPVVVMCLQAQRGDVVLMEQPELHLHPAPQQALGDFLLAMSVSGRQLIVETHSEYLINRLRLRIAKDDGEFVSSLIKIIYAERREGQTHFRSIRPNAYGSFDDWPDNFFDQAPKETEEILLAAMAKRKRQQARAHDRQPTEAVD